MQAAWLLLACAPLSFMHLTLRHPVRPNTKKLTKGHFLSAALCFRMQGGK